jgi:aliphatic sulfonates family ABC transporter substrate-binding protein
MHQLSRRSVLALGAAAAFVGGAKAQPISELRIGFQKTSVLLIAKAQGALERRFDARGIKVKWIEFAFGPPLLEAVNAGAVDFGYTGDAPPIFAQAARAKILYVGAIPSRGEGQAILVRKDSSLNKASDLKGRKIGVAKGSSAHNLLVSALEADGVEWAEIEPIYLAPADAAAAFSKGAINAWAIWDPYFAIAELRQGARALPLNPSVGQQNSFFLANRDFVVKNPALIGEINEEIARATDWIGKHRDEAAGLFSEASGVDLVAQQKAVSRAEFSFGPMDARLVDSQQKIADRFHKLGLIPQPIHVQDIVWSWASKQ